MAYLDNNGVLYLWGKIKSYVSTAINAIVIPSKTSELTNDSGFITSDDVPEGAAASTTTPKMDGTAEVGSETAFARGDHRHPTDTSRASASDLTSHTGNTTVHITSTERTSWNGKYAKPSGGIPASDLADGVIPDVSDKVDKITNYGLATIKSNEGNYTIIVQEGQNSSTNAAVVSTGTFATAMQQAMAALAGKADASALENYALKSDISSMYKYRGSVATVSALPSSGNTTGDVYNVESTGMNYAWDGTAWDALGESFQITAITNAEIDEICT